MTITETVTQNTNLFIHKNSWSISFIDGILRDISGLINLMEAKFAPKETYYKVIIQCKSPNMITLVQSQTDDINQIKTIAKSTT